MRINRKFAAIAAGITLAVAGQAAFADTVYNNLDNSIDSNLEAMTLTYNSTTLTGSSGTTTLAIQVDGHPDHPGCNIQGAHYVSLDAVVSDPTVASVSLSNGGTFNACGDTVVATVQALSVGTTTVTFVIDAARTNNDPALTFRLGEAAFTVTVNDDPLIPPVTFGCDEDPAAPAWAAAILQKGGIKPGSKQGSNYISTIAHEMGQGATFATYAKNAHPAYENAVQARLVQLTGKSLPSAQDAARPGWECAPE